MRLIKAANSRFSLRLFCEFRTFFAENQHLWDFVFNLREGRGAMSRRQGAIEFLLLIADSQHLWDFVFNLREGRGAMSRQGVLTFRTLIAESQHVRDFVFALLIG